MSMCIICLAVCSCTAYAVLRGDEVEAMTTTSSLWALRRVLERSGCCHSRRGGLTLPRRHGATPERAHRCGEFE